MAGQTPRVHQVWPLTQLFIGWEEGINGLGIRDSLLTRKPFMKGFLWAEEVAEFRKFQGHPVSR